MRTDRTRPNAVLLVARIYKGVLLLMGYALPKLVLNGNQAESNVCVRKGGPLKTDKRGDVLPGTLRCGKIYDSMGHEVAIHELCRSTIRRAGPHGLPIPPVVRHLVHHTQFLKLIIALLYTLPPSSCALPLFSLISHTPARDQALLSESPHPASLQLMGTFHSFQSCDPS